MDLYDVATQKIASIEAELKKLHMRQEEALDPALLENLTPFGMERMMPGQWLQFVLIPRVNEIIEIRGAFPEKSDVAVRAAHVLEGDQYTELIHLLGQFDLLINDRISIL